MISFDVGARWSEELWWSQWVNRPRWVWRPKVKQWDPCTKGKLRTRKFGGRAVKSNGVSRREESE